MTIRHEILNRVDRPEDNVQIVELQHTLLVNFTKESTGTRYAAILCNLACTTSKMVCSVISPENRMIILSRNGLTKADLYREFDDQFYDHKGSPHIATDVELVRFRRYFTTPVPSHTVSISLRLLQG